MSMLEINRSFAAIRHMAGALIEAGVSSAVNVPERPVGDWFVGAAAGLLLLVAPAARANNPMQDPLDVQSGPSIGTGAAEPGSYGLNSFESINLYNGNVNHHIPLHTIGGRGEAGYQMVLGLNSRGWTTNSRCPPATGEGGPCYPPDGAYPPGQGPGPRPPEQDYSPGHLEIHYAVQGTFSVCPDGTAAVWGYTRLTFHSSDGTEYTFREGPVIPDPTLYPGYGGTFTKGRPMHGLCNGGGIDSAVGFNRKKNWVSMDALSATFESDVDIFDYPGPTQCLSGTSDCLNGMMYFRDGRKYKIEKGYVKYIIDRNGNKTLFTYDDQAYDPSINHFRRVKDVTDSIGRKTTISYDVPAANCGDPAYRPSAIVSCDIISWYGAEGDPVSTFPPGDPHGSRQRLLLIYKYQMHDVFRFDSGLPHRALSFYELFPDFIPSYNATIYDPVVVGRVTYPNGPFYQLYYNQYREITQVDLPTTGSVQYTYTYDPVTVSSSNPNRILLSRKLIGRVVLDGGQFKGRSSYAIQVVGADTKTTVTDFDQPTGGLQRSTVHRFHGIYNLVPPDVEHDPCWADGKEYSTQVMDSAGVLLRGTDQHWHQDPLPWYTGGAEWCGPLNSPVMDSATTTEAGAGGTSLISSHKDMTYDDYGNVTDVKEYDYSGNLWREHTTSYFFGSGKDYIGDAAGVYIRNLPYVQSTLEGTTLRAQTVNYYDQEPITDRPGAMNHDTSYNASWPWRGNREAVATEDIAAGHWVVTRTQHDSLGNVVTSRDGNNNLTTYAYDDVYGYASQHECESNTGQGGTLYTNTFAFPTKVSKTITKPDGSSLTLTTHNKYDYFTGKNVCSEDPNGVNTSYYYATNADDADRLTQIWRGNFGTSEDPYQQQTNYFYVDNGYGAPAVFADTDVYAERDAAQRVETYYDGWGRPKEVRQCDTGACTSYVTTLKEYDGLGRLYRVSNPFRPGETVQWTVTLYDALDRPVRVQQPGSDGAVTVTSYAANVTTITDPSGKARQITYDSGHRITKVVEDPGGLNYVTNYTYDVLDNLTSVSQGAQTRSFTYDSLSRLRSATNPENGTVTYTYDDNGNMTSRRDARMVTLNQAFDGLNRVLTKNYDDGTPNVTYTYDGSACGPSYGRPICSIGRLLKYESTSSNNTIANIIDEYDRYGRPVRQRQLTNGIQFPFNYSYDLLGDVTSETYPSGRAVTTSYDIWGRPTRVGEGTAVTYADQVTYASHGGLKDLRLGNGLWESTSYTERLLPKTMSLGSQTGAGDIWQLENSYAANNNVLWQTLTTAGMSFVTGYDYDGVNRLVQGKETTGGAMSWLEQYGYDQYGNNWVSAATGVTLSQVTPRGTGDVSGDTNRLVNSTAYDPAGNMTGNAEGWQYGYDAENRQISMGTAVNATYVYDGEGHRVSKTVNGVQTTFVYDALGRLSAEVTNGSAGTTGTQFLTQDHLGSTRLVTDGTGAVAARYDYVPFGGEVPASAGGRFNIPGYGLDIKLKLKFTAKEHDGESGLDYFGARYHSSAMDRFMSVDPSIAFEKALQDPQRWHRYAYVRNNPVMFVDPDGRDSLMFASVGPNAVVDDMWRSGALSTNSYNAINVAQAKMMAVMAVTAVASEALVAVLAADATPTITSLGLFEGAGATGAPIVEGAAASGGATVAGIEQGAAAGAAESPVITKAYQRPTGATTAAQRASVQGKACVDCGAQEATMVADHKTPLVKEYYETGTIDKAKMHDPAAVQPQCQTCSAKQGAELSQYSKMKKKELGL